MSTIVCSTPDQVSAFRLMSVKYQLRLEELGLKSSGGALRPRLAKEFGLSPRAPRKAYVDYINAKLQEMNPNYTPKE